MTLLEHRSSVDRFVARTAVFYDLYTSGWPIVRLEASTSTLVFSTKWLKVPGPTDLLADGGRQLIIRSGDLLEVRRNGLVLRWGYILVTRGGTIGCWGPRVGRGIRHLDGPHKIIDEPRRLFWRTKLWL